MPLFAPGLTFHSSSSSKLPNFSLVTMSCPSAPTMVLIAPSCTFQEWSGNELILYPRHLSTDLPSNRTCHLPGFAFASAPERENEAANSEARMREKISLV